VRTVLATCAALLVVCAFATAAPAPDINGKWHAQVPWPGRNLTDFYFTFKVDGPKLTGTVIYAVGDGISRMEIQEGKAGADGISFFVIGQMRNADMKMTFKGTPQEGQIPFTLDVPPMAPPAPAPGAAAPAPAAPASPAAPSLLEFIAKRN
jgi:hypothetical protein